MILGKCPYSSHLLLASLSSPATRYLDLLQGQTRFHVAKLVQELDQPHLAKLVDLSILRLQAVEKPHGFGLHE